MGRLPIAISNGTKQCFSQKPVGTLDFQLATLHLSCRHILSLLVNSGVQRVKRIPWINQVEGKHVGSVTNKAGKVLVGNYWDEGA